MQTWLYGWRTAFSGESSSKRVERAECTDVEAESDAGLVGELGGGSLAEDADGGGEGRDGEERRGDGLDPTGVCGREEGRGDADLCLAAIWLGSFDQGILRSFTVWTF